MLNATRFVVPLISLGLGLAACMGAPEGDDAAVDVVPGALGHATLPVGESAAGFLSSGTVTDTTPMSNHGGPVMSSTTHIYLIWYGNWSGNSATTILTDLASNIGGSAWFNINTSYGVPNSVTYAGSTTDSYSQGTTLSNSSVQTIVSSAITSGRLPVDANGVYFVLTSSDVNESSGFCTSYCGWHTHGTISNTDIKFSFVGNGDRCPSACQAQTTSPNSNAGADGMASVLAHELAETVTDPDLNAWYDTQGNENADKCAWTWGTTYRTSNGAYANEHLGSRDYLIQQNWLNTGGTYCAAYYSASSILNANQSLTSGQSMSSQDGRFTLIMQSDGNLVLYWNGHGALWATGTNGKGQIATMQGDGNFVVYDGSGHAVWASNTNGHSGAGLTVQNDGNVVIYQSNSALWASNTCCH
jgi:hypothetical protein